MINKKIRLNNAKAIDQPTNERNNQTKLISTNNFQRSAVCNLIMSQNI